MSRKPNESKRDYQQALEQARFQLDDAEAAFARGDQSTLAGNLLAAAESLGLAMGHLHYMADVDPETLGQYRGQRDRLATLTRVFRGQRVDPRAELRFNPRAIKRRLT